MKFKSKIVIALGGNALGNNLKEQIAGKFHKSVDICDFYSEQKMQDDKIVKGAIYV